MKTLRYATGMLLFVGLLAPGLRAQDLSKGKWIDLTHTFSRETIYWPNADAFELTSVYQGETDKGFWYEANNFKAAEHGGTHVDAPVHFAFGKHTVDEIPIDTSRPYVEPLIHFFRARMQRH